MLSYVAYRPYMEIKSYMMYIVKLAHIDEKYSSSSIPHVICFENEVHACMFKLIYS
jgi:hypothetical protein